jgi:hypothetical protein
MSVGTARREFRLRLGDVSAPFENIDHGEELVVEWTVDGGSNWTLLNQFSSNDTTFIQSNTWALATFDPVGKWK